MRRKNGPRHRPQECVIPKTARTLQRGERSGVERPGIKPPTNDHRPSYRTIFAVVIACPTCRCVWSAT